MYWNVTGVMYAGNGSIGNSINQLTAPAGIFVNANDTLFISDGYNCRVLSYPPDNTNVTMVAGIGKCGVTLNRFAAHMRYLYVDANANIYIADTNNHRVVRWAPGSSAGVIVAGNGTAGTSLEQLNSPYGVWVDSSVNVYVSDYNNHRVMRWDSGASAGVLVAGITNSSGKRIGSKTSRFY